MLKSAIKSISTKKSQIKIQTKRSKRNNQLGNKNKSVLANELNFDGDSITETKNIAKISLQLLDPKLEDPKLEDPK